MRDYQHVVATFTFETGSKGIFDFYVGDTLLFSKKAIGRHANEGEVFELFKNFIGEEVQLYGT